VLTDQSVLPTAPRPHFVTLLIYHIISYGASTNSIYRLYPAVLRPGRALDFLHNCNFCLQSAARRSCTLTFFCEKRWCHSLLLSLLRRNLEVTQEVYCYRFSSVLSASSAIFVSSSMEMAFILRSSAFCASISCISSTGSLSISGRYFLKIRIIKLEETIA